MHISNPRKHADWRLTKIIRIMSTKEEDMWVWAKPGSNHSVRELVNVQIWETHAHAHTYTLSHCGNIWWWVWEPTVVVFISHTCAWVIYIYIYMHICIYVHMFICMHACTSMSKYVFVKKGTIDSVSYAVCYILELVMSKDETGNKK